MDVVYRPAHLSDVEKLWELFEVLKIERTGMSFSEVDSRNEIRKWLEAENIFLYIAEQDDSVLSAFRAVRGTEQNMRHAAVLSIATHPDYRNQGIARELINMGLEDMKKDGVTLARAYIYSDNIPSVSTALKLGFTLSGTVYRHHFNDSLKQYVDDLIFHKLLD